MAIIQIDDNYRLRSDARQWIIEKKSIKQNDKGNDVYSPKFYYSTLEGAVNGLFNYQVRTSEATNIAEFMADSKAVLSKIVESLCPEYRVTKA